MTADAAELPGIAIVIGDPGTIVKGQIAGLECWVVNERGVPVEGFEVELASPALERSVSLSERRLEAGPSASEVHALNVKVVEFGNPFLLVAATCRIGGEVHALRGRVQLEIHSGDASSSVSIHLQADKIMGNDLSRLVEIGTQRSATVPKDRELWKIDLEPDPVRTAALRAEAECRAPTAAVEGDGRSKVRPPLLVLMGGLLAAALGSAVFLSSGALPTAPAPPDIDEPGATEEARAGGTVEGTTPTDAGAAKREGPETEEIDAPVVIAEDPMPPIGAGPVEDVAGREKTEPTPPTTAVPSGPATAPTAGGEDLTKASPSARPEAAPQVLAEPGNLHVVTNDEFRRFVEAGGYRDRSLWSRNGWAWRSERDIQRPRYFASPLLGQPDGAVVGLSWYEAEAYARWADAKLPGREAALDHCRTESGDRGERLWLWTRDRNPRFAAAYEVVRCTDRADGYFPPGQREQDLALALIR